MHSDAIFPNDQPRPMRTFPHWTVDVDGLSVSTHGKEQEALQEAERSAAQDRGPVEVSRWDEPAWTVPDEGGPVCTERRRIYPPV